MVEQLKKTYRWQQFIDWYIETYAIVKDHADTIMDLRFKVTPIEMWYGAFWRFIKEEKLVLYAEQGFNTSQETERFLYYTNTSISEGHECDTFEEFVVEIFNLK